MIYVDDNYKVFYEPSFFSQSDFNNCFPPCQLEQMNPFFLERLDYARLQAGTPFVLNSAYRTEDWEKQHNRPGTSSHTKGLAVDIRVVDGNPYLRSVIVRSLVLSGFNRIGIAKNYIHVDADTDKPAAIWLYD